MSLDIMSAFDNSSKPPTENQWHPMGSGFTASAPSSTPLAPRETWQQRMSRRVIQRRDPSDPRDPRVSPATHHPRDLPRPRAP